MTLRKNYIWLVQLCVPFLSPFDEISLPEQFLLLFDARFDEMQDLAVQIYDHRLTMVSVLYLVPHLFRIDHMCQYCGCVPSQNIHSFRILCERSTFYIIFAYYIIVSIKPVSAYSNDSPCQHQKKIYGVLLDNLWSLDKSKFSRAFTAELHKNLDLFAYWLNYWLVKWAPWLLSSFS